MIFAWMEATAAAGVMRNSLWVTASLSALHALSFAVVMGSAFLLNLRLLGLLFRDRPVREVAGPAKAGLGAGVAMSVATGVLLFLPRAVAAADDDAFRMKMLFLLTAAGFAWVQVRGLAAGAPVTADRARGALGLVLWMGLALSACAFILLE
ncbi:MAG: DUF6644 family protein [Vicinamibacterales bacterium]